MLLSLFGAIMPDAIAHRLGTCQDSSGARSENFGGSSLTRSHRPNSADVSVLPFILPPVSQVQ
jgi:hypothetical protein